MKIFSRMTARIAPLIVVLLALAPAAMCMAVTAPRMPNDLRRAVPAWLGYLVMAVMAGIVIAISLMPSKRSHQD